MKVGAVNRHLRQARNRYKQCANFCLDKRCFLNESFKLNKLVRHNKLPYQNCLTESAQQTCSKELLN